MTKSVYLKPSDASLLNSTGGHALIAIGYHSTKGVFLVQNSQGKYYNHSVEGVKEDFECHTNCLS